MDTSERAPKFFTTFNTAKMLGVDMTTVIDWCRQGKLQAFKTPGGHRRISPRDLIKFLQTYKMPIPSVLEPMAHLQCLIVDDEAMIRKAVARAIKEIEPEANVELAEDGFDAGKKLVDQLPHLVVLDLMLPGIDGFKVCEKIRRDSRLKDTKILAISALSETDVRRKIIAAGANDFLSKPFQVEELERRIRALLGREREKA